MATIYNNELGACIGYMKDVGPIYAWTPVPRIRQEDIVGMCGGEFAYNAQLEFYGRH